MTPSREHGPLPDFLVGLTVVSGLVDSFSYLTLGHVFVANMTGNVVFLGFALSGTGEVSVVDSLLALLAFVFGAAIAGRIAAKRPPHRGHLLAAGAAAQALLVLIAAVTTSALHSTSVRLTLIALLAIAMGGQNAVVRRLGVPDLTTTVITRTVAGLVADSAARPVLARRLASVTALLTGALLGGTLLRWAPIGAPLWLAATLLLACAAGVYRMTRGPAAEAWR
ncbi:YoaK family protein [Rhizocola hellebori]|nr:YoaK family protein [Rhizocola hellebori]